MNEALTVLEKEPAKGRKTMTMENAC